MSLPPASTYVPVYCTTDDVVALLDGSYVASGSEPNRVITFWNQNRDEVFVLKNIEIAEKFVKWMVGNATFQSSDSDTNNTVQILCWTYAAFRVGVVLIGGVITRGFDYKLGELSISRQSGQTSAYKAIVDGLKMQGEHMLQGLIPYSLSNDTMEANYQDTAPYQGP